MIIVLQILRVNWARAAIVTSFARAVSLMAPALQLSVLPLINSIVTELITEPHELFSLMSNVRCEHDFVPGVSRLPESWRSQLVNVQRLLDTKYFKRCIAPTASASGAKRKHFES